TAAVLGRFAAAFEVDRVAAERHLLFRHSVSLRRLGCGGPARRLPIGRGYYLRTPRARKAKNTMGGGVATRENYREGVFVGRGPDGAPSRALPQEQQVAWAKPALERGHSSTTHVRPSIVIWRASRRRPPRRGR